MGYITKIYVKWNFSCPAAEQISYSPPAQSKFGQPEAEFPWPEICNSVGRSFWQSGPIIFFAQVFFFKGTTPYYLGWIDLVL